MPSYFLALSYIIFLSTLGSNEAEQCPHSAPTTEVQRYDFIQSEYESKLLYPQFCDPAMASTGCGAPPVHDRLRRFWAEMTFTCHGIGPRPLAANRKKQSATHYRALIGDGLGWPTAQNRYSNVVSIKQSCRGYAVETKHSHWDTDASSQIRWKIARRCYLTFCW